MRSHVSCSNDIVNIMENISTDAPSVTLDEEVVTVRAGHSVRLGCSVESYPDPVISWSYSNRAITKGKS